MARLARKAASDPEFQARAEALGSIDAVESFVRANFAYRDEEEEIVRSPEFMLADMGRNDGGRIVRLEGDCDDVSTLFVAFCKALGHPARFVAIRYDPTNPNFEHVFAEAYDGRIWRVLDATVAKGTRIQWIEQMIEEV